VADLKYHVNENNKSKLHS